jgi:hypothetical protein
MHMLRQRGWTYDWGPSEVFSKEHVLLLLCARHPVYRISFLVVLLAMFNLRRCDAPRSCLLRPASYWTTGTSACANADRLSFLSWTIAWARAREDCAPARALICVCRL